MADRTEQAPRMRGWVRVVLFVSLALNLAVVGLVAGVALRHGGEKRAGPPRADHMSLAYVRALDRTDREAIRDAMRAALPDRAQLRAGQRAAFAAVLAAVRSDSFDPAEVERLLEAQFAVSEGRQQLGRQFLIERLGMMSAAERAAFADRVEENLTKLDDWRKRRDER